MNEYAKKYNTAFRQALADARFVVLEKRYDRSETDTSWTNGSFVLDVVYDTTPNATNSKDSSYIGHGMIGGGTMDLDQAEFLMKVLFWDCSVYEFKDLDETTRHYITHNIAPSEWQSSLDRKSPEHMSRFKVYGYEKPSLPENLDEMDEKFWNVSA